METIRDGLEAAEEEVNKALDEEDSKPDEPQLTPEQLKTKRVFESYDENADDLLSWPEWQGYIR